MWLDPPLSHEPTSQNSLFRVEMTIPVQMEPDPLVEFDDMIRLDFRCHLPNRRSAMPK